MALGVRVVVTIFLNFLSFAVGLELYESPNVKTALFTELDVRRSCWNHDEISLLRARMIMQDLIPKKIPRDFPYLVEYLRSTEEAVVRHSPEGKLRRIMMLSLSDIIGGYLQAVVIPMAKESYYAGNIDYTTMSKLYDMYTEMKSRLRTDGGRWSRPLDMSKFAVKVTQLNLYEGSSELACKAIYVTSRESCPEGQSRIAIPYLDYDLKPGAVALPLKSRNLYSLKTAASSHIIVRFYILARECLSDMSASETEVFNYLFLRWLLASVVPHLYETTWYPGFGSVMRIVQTINETEISLQRPVNNVNDTSLEQSLLSGKCGILKTVKMLIKYNFWLLILFLFLCMLIFTVCCCCAWWTYSYYRGYGAVGSKGSGILNAVLSIYCGLKDYDEPDMGSKNISGTGYFDPVTGSFRNSSNTARRQSPRPTDFRHSSQYQPDTSVPPPGHPRPAGDVDTSTVPSSTEDEDGESVTSSTSKP
ncbi:uncharacterized protein LOC124356597 [Homalodisca vitripennis]|uniref:uncharacterized protein LOC124356597 n=1 Tax=Homalodisca vitripennis TaxID=197043 RepID=UPI001EEC52E5|nr:uncharacterized protein LOC124356597 [Homalodisca vitripennis]KAG8287013.1 hypothetical protein J6590_046988 [Homalodisca vitripennis]